MLRVAICEDDPIQIQALTGLMAGYQSVRHDLELFADAYESGGELLESLESGRIYDIFFLDILMPGINGIDLARELRLRGEEAPLVFLTSSADYALDAFDVYATQYILKPVNADKLFPVMDKIAGSLKKEDEKFFFVSTAERMVKVPFSSIVCVESIWRTIQVYLADGRKLSGKTIRVPFEKATSALLQDSRFLHAHKSFILNMSQVTEITGSSFIMKGGAEVPVPRYRYAEVKSRYLDYISRRGMDQTDGR